MTTIETNLQAVRQRIAAACAAAGRDAAQVQLLAVSKTFPAASVSDAIAAGQLQFGENYIQEAVAKIEALPRAGITWHCIGPVQSNKTRLVAEHFDWLQSLDRLKIAQRLNEQRPPAMAPLQVCIQVNVDGGPTKAGVSPDELPELARAIAQLPGLRLRGLMTIPEPAPDFDAARAVHARARQLFDRLNAEGMALDTLSMGMSGDLEAAIHAGSTMVRVGTAVFGARERPGH
ncbi:MAG: YggS family pyridoxal phosphate-dependent enzyme [Burkholderiaceae bacterium]|nr:YggS family pyridoxal phosphate-dependent enzyme [Rhodoferax sp.]